LNSRKCPQCEVLDFARHHFLGTEGLALTLYELVRAKRVHVGAVKLPFTIPGVAVGAIIAALIAGLVSLLGLIVSKEQKVSDFRQAWIDGLRSEIASLVSHANAIHGSLTVRHISFTGSELGKLADYWKDTIKHYVDINDAIYRVRLRLNPQEPPSQKVLQTIGQIEEMLVPGKDLDHDALADHEERLVMETNAVLKAEWQRVKSGEIVYKVSKYLALLVVISCVLIGIGFAIWSITKPQLSADQQTIGSAD